MPKYEVRKTANENSRGRAGHHAEPWSENEVSTLMTLFTTDPKDLECLAEMLGRTVEACRQRYYQQLNGQAKTVPAKDAEEQMKKANTWTTGFTSLEDMGY